jgi:glutamine cyclotransferase
MERKENSLIPAGPAEIKYEVIDQYPHDPSAYTEGLKFYNSFVYESTGGRGVTRSSLRRVELRTGRPLDLIAVNENYFAEGLTILNGRLFQLTLDSGVGLIYDVNDLNKPPVEFKYNGWTKGWGLTDDGRNLILSDGSDQLYFIDPVKIQIIGTPISVNVNGSPILSLNELEYIRGFVYANVLYSELVLRIDPANGNVLGQLDLSALRPPQTTNCVDCVLNGIAYDATSDHLLVTGKDWPTLYRIRLLN